MTADALDMLVFMNPLSSSAYGLAVGIALHFPLSFGDRALRADRAQVAVGELPLPSLDELAR